MKFLVWGTGKMAGVGNYLLSTMNVSNTVEIVGYVDNDSKKWGQLFNEYLIFSPNQIFNLEYDAITIWVAGEGKNNIRRQLVEELKVSSDKIIDIFEYLKQVICAKYAGCSDPEILEILDKMIQYQWLKVYYYEPQDPDNELQEVFYDESAGLHYVFFENKRMYLKRTYGGFVIKNDRKYTKSFWREQDANSPHLYEEGEIQVNVGDVLIDAGVCEGNFSLHNIDKVKKVYLIECDQEWMEALHYTFMPYKDKVVFCDKFLSDFDDGENRITIDLLVKEPVDFIKMDIEGEEINALIGAKRVFAESNNVKCAVCVYHRHNDEKIINAILKEYGMDTYTSKGYMLFIYDEYGDIELRRGIIRGKKI